MKDLANEMRIICEQYGVQHEAREALQRFIDSNFNTVNSTVTISGIALDRLSPEEQGKFIEHEFKRMANTLGQKLLEVIPPIKEKNFIDTRYRFQALIYLPKKGN